MGSAFVMLLAVSTIASLTSGWLSPVSVQLRFVLAAKVEERDCGRTSLPPRLILGGLTEMMRMRYICPCCADLEQAYTLGMLVSLPNQCASYLSWLILFHRATCQENHPRLFRKSQHSWICGSL